MAFDPHAAKFKMTQRFKPVVLLLDVSGSMDEDGKIDHLYDAVTAMIHSFSEAAQKEISYKVAIITFGEDGAKLHTLYADVQSLQNLPRFSANGGTPLGHALMMAKDMIEDTNVTLKSWYRPTVVLVSDGQPNDSYKKPMRDFIEGININSGKKDRSTKCQRMAVGIGGDADENMLMSFVSEPDFYFHAENAADIDEKFDLLTTTTIQTTQRQSQIHATVGRQSFSASRNPKDAGGIRSRSTTRRGSVVGNSIPQDDDDDSLYN